MYNYRLIVLNEETAKLFKLRSGIVVVVPYFRATMKVFFFSLALEYYEIDQSHTLNVFASYVVTGSQ